MSGGKFDFRQVEHLQKQVEQIKNGRGQFCEDCVKELAANLLARVKKRTPVGLYQSGTGMTGGTLRRNWTIGEIQKTGDTYTIEIINPTEYASYVEYGHRTANHSGWVPGQFMMTISECELQTAAPAILERKLQRWLEEAFHA